MLEAGQKAGKSSIGFSVHADIFAGASQHPSPLQSTLPVEKTRNRTAVKKDVKDYSRLTRPKSWCGKPLRRIPCQLKASDKKDHESWVIKFQNYCPWSRCSPLSQEHYKRIAVDSHRAQVVTRPIKCHETSFDSRAYAVLSVIPDGLDSEARRSCWRGQGRTPPAANSFVRKTLASLVVSHPQIKHILNEKFTWEDKLKIVKDNLEHQSLQVFRNFQCWLGNCKEWRHAAQILKRKRQFVMFFFNLTYL